MFPLSLAILASENSKALKHRTETKLNIASDDWIPKQNEWAETKVVFYWDQPFQPKPVLVETVEVSNKTLFQPFLVDTRL